MSSTTIYTCEVCKREFPAGDTKVQGVMLYGYHTIMNRIEREHASNCDRHICWDCARNLAIAFFCFKPGDFKIGDAIIPRRYGE